MQKIHKNCIPNEEQEFIGIKPISITTNLTKCKIPISFQEFVKVFLFGFSEVQ